MADREYQHLIALIYCTFVVIRDVSKLHSTLHTSLLHIEYEDDDQTTMDRRVALNK